MDHETEARDAPSLLTAYEQAIGAQTRQTYRLRLYVTGTTPRSIRAIANLRNICEEYLPERYDLEVIDLYQQPHLAAGDQVVAAPTLIKLFPSPLKRIIGDMSNTAQVLVGLDLQHAAEGRRGE
ncbi:MAG: thiol-disulfide isomerase [Chthonomonadales bacterium]|nr:thiol-disulfide isomerase [Chthonomonadales bacterium]